MPLLHDFIQHCRHQPEQIAFSEGSRQISYAGLLNRIQSLSVLFQPGEAVAVLMDRGIDAATVILAIIHAGGCYIPLDNNNPSARLRRIIDDARPAAVVGHGQRPDWLPDSAAWLSIEKSLDERSRISPHPPANTDQEAIAAILYTSGSTGQPKGVALSYRAVAHFSQWMAKTFALSSSDRIASLAPFHFDLSLFDLFSSLQQGAQVHFIPPMLSLAPSRLSQWLADQAITVWYTVPSLLSFLALKGNLTQTPLPRLRCLLFAGEVFPTPALKKLAALLPATDFYNLYGPTETNVCCYWPVERRRLAENRAIPIGRPAAEAKLKIVPETQELWVDSDCNFSGYWHQGRLQPLTLQDGYYPTGDRVSVNSEGEYCYHGRLDRMLKCSGFRVEPAEIEAAICRHPHVAQCAVVGLSDDTAGQRPAAAIVLSQKTALNEILQPLRQQLPAYMLPSQVRILDRLPSLANGKIDYLSVTNLFQSS